MAKAVKKGTLLDVSYFLDDEKGIALNLFVKTQKGIEEFSEKKFKPYFYVVTDDAKKRLRELEKKEFGEEKIKPMKVEEVKKSNEENVLKLSFKNTHELITARESIEEMQGVKEKREYDIPFAKRFLIDQSIEPMNGLELEVNEKNEVQKLRVYNTKKDLLDELSVACFDIETYSPGRFSDPSRDPIVSIALSSGGKEKAFVWRQKPEKEKADFFETEKEMLEAFLNEMAKSKPDIIVTYNGDMFDFPYIKERARVLKVDLKKGFGSEPDVRRKGLQNAVKLKGIQHVDAYQIVRLMTRFGTVSLVKFDLESVSFELFGKEKEKMTPEQINKAWSTGTNIDALLQYNKEDAKTTLRIAETFLPLFFEFSKLVHQTLFDSTRSSAGQLVEDLLIEKSFENNALIPNKPQEGVVTQRLLQSFKGGYVKEPVAGLHENIAVLDFRSLHPSIMISHNVSPETLKCEHASCRNGKNLSPDKDWFCEKKRGFIPTIIEEILNKRIEIKNEMKKFKEGTPEFESLKARQHALKIVLNSHYGYLGYARSRWYSRESARAVTAWSRHYIRESIHKAEKAGFNPIYSDTDSLFIIVPKGKTEKDVNAFVKKINSELPGAMELEFEGYYKRGIFVTKKEGGAAKKRYALVDFKDSLKIVGFEYVRRDWARIAKETQKEVIEAVLKEGKPEKAVEIVKKIVERLKKGEVTKKELIIMTQIRRPLNKYENIGPHVAAAQKAVKTGKEVGVGSTISFIITKSGKSISDKAELEEFVKEGNYDADYYINHQVLPAIIKILAELGYSEEDLIQGGKQQSLSSFM